MCGETVHKGTNHATHRVEVVGIWSQVVNRHDQHAVNTVGAKTIHHSEKVHKVTKRVETSQVQYFVLEYTSQGTKHVEVVDIFLRRTLILSLEKTDQAPKNETQ